MGVSLITQEEAGELREPAKAKSGVTRSQLTPLWMAKATLCCRACWSCSLLTPGIIPLLATLVPRVFWTWSPDRSTNQ